MAKNVLVKNRENIKNYQKIYEIWVQNVISKIFFIEGHMNFFRNISQILLLFLYRQTFCNYHISLTKKISVTCLPHLQNKPRLLINGGNFSTRIDLWRL